MTDAKATDEARVPNPDADYPLPADHGPGVTENSAGRPGERLAAKPLGRLRRALPLGAQKIPLDNKASLFTTAGLLVVVAAAVYMAWTFINPTL